MYSGAVGVWHMPVFGGAGGAKWRSGIIVVVGSKIKNAIVLTSISAVVSKSGGDLGVASIMFVSCDEAAGTLRGGAASQNIKL